jgi:hypothetical protein
MLVLKHQTMDLAPTLLLVANTSLALVATDTAETLDLAPSLLQEQQGSSLYSLPAT